MTFYVFQDASQGAYFVILIVSVPIVITAIILRFIATNLTHRKPALEDWFALSAVAIFLTRVGVVLYALTVINGRNEALAFDLVAYERSFKMIFVADLITCLDQTLAKFSIMALYYRIFSVNRLYVRCIYVLAACQVAVYIALLFMTFFQCRPLEAFWKWWVQGSCMEYKVILIVIEPPNSIIDFLLVVLAMFMIRALHITRATKWKLRFLFGLGSLAGIFGFIKIGITYAPSLTNPSASLGLWAVVQSVAVIVCCCAPVYKPLSPQIKLWSRWTSRTRKYNPDTQKSKSSSGYAVLLKTMNNGQGGLNTNNKTNSQHSQIGLRDDEFNNENYV